MKKLLLLSDTHFTDGLAFPDLILDHIDACDMIIHAGDFTSLDTYEELQVYRPVIAARGNMDGPHLAGLLPEINEVEIYGNRIGVIHGWGSPDGIVERIYPKVARGRYDLVVYGHSHMADISSMGGILFVNPGSPTSSRLSRYESFGILTITEEGIQAPEIIPF